MVFNEYTATSKYFHSLFYDLVVGLGHNSTLWFIDF